MSQFTRKCPSCGGMITYTSAGGLAKAVAGGKPCQGCSRRRGVPSVLRGKILEAYEQSLTNREIAAVAGCAHKTVAYWLKKEGLKPHLSRGVPPERVDDEHSRCRKCDTVQRNDQFPFVRGQIDGRRLSICRTCRAQDARRALGASPESYFNDKQRRLSNGERGSRPSRQHLTYDLPDGYLAALWHWQDGRCFYTGKPMKMGLGVGRDPYGVSIDRVDPSKGYLVGNVVLACSRVNSVKNNLTIGELAEWIPAWHEQIVQRLPVLAREVVPVEDNWPRNARGHRLPSWIVERRQRMAALTEQVNYGNF